MTSKYIKSKNSKGSAPHKVRSLFARRLYGRRQGRALGKERQNALDTLLPKLGIPEDKLTHDHTCQPQDLFPAPLSSFWLEIGFGHGEHVTALAQQNPDTGYIGAEPFINGMAAFCKKLEEAGYCNTERHEANQASNSEAAICSPVPLGVQNKTNRASETSDNLFVKDNIRVLMDDGVIIARSLTPASLDGVYILNPDPWHKKRHHKRRIINQTNLDVFANVLKPGGKLVMTSDVEDLAAWMCTHASNHPEFDWQAKSKADWSIPPQDWFSTRYEQKGAKGTKKMVYLFFKRK